MYVHHSYTNGFSGVRIMVKMEVVFYEKNLLWLYHLQCFCQQWLMLVITITSSYGTEKFRQDGFRAMMRVALTTSVTKR